MTRLNETAASVTERYAKAVSARDLSAFCALYSESASIFDAWMKWKYASAADWRKNIDDWFKMIPAGETTRVSFEDISQLPNGLAATITYASVGPDGHVLRSMQNRLTWIFGDDGKIAHEHTSAPLDFATGKAILKA